MYAYVKGLLEVIKDDHIVIEVAGIGYEIFCPNPYRFQSDLKTEVKVYTYFHVREDAQILFGFKVEEEKDLFKKLLNVSGIGPKNALKIVGETSVHEFAMAIEQENDTYLTKFPGIGKKTARQMILDLKGKVSEWMNGGLDVSVESNPSDVSNEIYEEAVEALMALGYSSKEINKVSTKLKAFESTSTDDLVRKGLQLLMR